MMTEITKSSTTILDKSPTIMLDKSSTNVLEKCTSTTNSTIKSTDEKLSFRNYSTTRRWVLPVTAFMVLVTGTANMLLISMLNRTEITKCKNLDCDENDLGYFEAPFTQQLANGVGQMTCLLVFYVDNWVSKFRKKGRRVLDYDRRDIDSWENLPEPSPYLWVFPAVLDFVASVMLLYALVLENASSVQILRTFSVILCAILSVSYLHRDLRVFHWLGICLMTIGLLLTGWDSINSSINESKEVRTGARWLGVFLTLISTVLTVFQLVFEERLVSNYRCSPFQGVGWIGIWETVIVLFASLCAHIANYERLDVVWWQISQNSRLQIGIIGFAISTAIFTACSLAVTKMGAALLTSTVTALRQVPIWALELILQWTVFGWAGFFGMLLTCIGFIVYNHLLPTKYCSPYERFAMKEVRIRCSCHDDDDDDTEDDIDEEEIEEEEDLQNENRHQLGTGHDLEAGHEKSVKIKDRTQPYANHEDTKTISSTIQPNKQSNENHQAMLVPSESSTSTFDGNFWKTAIITTKKDRAPPHHADSDSAWIYVRRSEEWILTSEKPK